MSRGYQSLSLDGEELKLRMKEAKSIDEYKRYQAVHLRVNEGMEVSVISRVTGLSESSVHRIHSHCRRKGLSSISSIGRGGRYRSYLSIEEEKEMLYQVS